MVFIIAEAGINHGGDMNLAHNMIRESAIAGADAVKFQLYSVEKLFGPNGQDPRPDICDKIRHLELTYENVKQLKYWCWEEHIEFMASVFDTERLSWLESLSVQRHKVASRVSKLDPGLAEAVAKIGKTTYMALGFGARPLDPILYSNVQYLYCVSKYPTEFCDLKLPRYFGYSMEDDVCWSGFSDHSIGIEASLVAIARGARVIEKHVTFNKSNSGPDHVCSITFEELKELVKYSKLMQKVIKNC